MKLPILLSLSLAFYSTLYLGYNMPALSSPIPKITYVPTMPMPQHRMIKGEQINRSSTVSASIGSGKKIIIYGYTSPSASVSIEGKGIADNTTARDNGYFEFANIYSPIVANDVCLTSVDTLGRSTSPICIPPLPMHATANIGPIILPPSVSLNTGEAYIGGRVILTGMTIPNQPVNMSFFKDEKRSIFKTILHQIAPIVFASNDVLGTGCWMLDAGCSRIEDLGSRIKELASTVIPHIKNAEAFSFPELSTKSDTNGNFSVEVPSSNQSFLRSFAQVDYKNNPSPKSLTLHIKILPIWTIILTLITALIVFIGKYFLVLLFIVELLILIIYILRHFLHPFYLARSLSIVVYEKRQLSLRDTLEIGKI